MAVNGGAVRYEYDGDGNRVSKAVGGVTTAFLVDTNNPTGYAQVVDEMQGGVVTRAYAYGHDLISQRQLINNEWLTSFYGYDGHGSVRYSTNTEGAVTDTYAYDAFGTLISRTGSTPNDYLYAGERFDAETGMYHLRARYMNPGTGRFWSLDSYEGSPYDPPSLHKYTYVHNNPVTGVDPSGHSFVSTAISTVTNLAVIAANITARILPAAAILGHRIAYWGFVNQTRIEFYYTMSAAALIFVEWSTGVLLNNVEPVVLQNDNPGDWVEERTPMGTKS